MWRRFLLTGIVGLFIALAGGPGAADAATAKSARSGLLIGVWERTLHNDAGPDPVIVMELKADGTYSVSGVPFVEDHGTFTMGSPWVLTFTSKVSPNHNRMLALKMEGENAFTLFTTVPAYAEVWTRIQDAPNFPSVAVGGADIPKELPLLMASALAAEAQLWRNDAMPTWLEVDRMKSGRYQITLHLFSPSATEEMQIKVTEYGISESVHDGSRAVTAPLPPNFLDLPRIVEAAGAQGFKGALKKAGVRTYKDYGPAWMTVFAGARTGATFSATTGKRIHTDVTGYIAQYEADWNHAADQWRKAMAQYRKQHENYGECEPIEVWGPSCLPSEFYRKKLRYGAKTRSQCHGYGGKWGSGGCY